MKLTAKNIVNAIGLQEFELFIQENEQRLNSLSEEIRGDIAQAAMSDWIQWYYYYGTGTQARVYQYYG